MKRTIAFGVLIITTTIILSMVFGTEWSDMDVNKPADNRRWDLADNDIRVNWAAIVANLTLTDGAVVIGNGTGALQVVALGTAGQHFTMNDDANMPEWTNLTDATMPASVRTHHYLFNVQDPNGVYNRDTQICIDPNTSGALTITEVQVTCDADPTTELNWNINWADAFIGLANSTLIVACDTTNGAADIDSGFSDATIAVGKCIYMEFDDAPDPNITQISVKVTWDYD